MTEKQHPPIYEDVTRTNASGNCYYIYRESILERNIIIKRTDDVEEMFCGNFQFLNLTPSYSTLCATACDWKMVLHWGKDFKGPIAITMGSKGQNQKVCRDVNIIDHASKSTVVFHCTASFKRYYKWSYNDVEYAWIGNGFSGNLNLIQLPEKRIIAEFHRYSRFSLKKIGKLAILQDSQIISRFVIATAVAVELQESEVLF
ncbi:hypothetical protein HDV06_001069 [Boothiomyces sp. JEL0866]|nr:hypothetical protein HDV06_001069 [Boothiomyces sp. JEL0866]